MFNSFSVEESMPTILQLKVIEQLIIINETWFGIRKKGKWAKELDKLKGIKMFTHRSLYCRPKRLAPRSWCRATFQRLNCWRSRQFCQNRSSYKSQRRLHALEICQPLCCWSRNLLWLSSTRTCSWPLKFARRTRRSISRSQTFQPTTWLLLKQKGIVQFLNETSHAFPV